MVGTSEERSEIAFFDVETTVPTRPGQGFAILEFGAILVCPKKLVELRHYTTLVRPADPSHISSLSVRCNGITKDAVVSAPSFIDIADTVYNILHGRIWAGHNILRFDCARIREAFAQINRPAPEPKGTIDSLALLTQKFGRRAGDMKVNIWGGEDIGVLFPRRRVGGGGMASLATYFGLGQQTHRSLDDVRMNLEVLKYCATVLFLESSLPDVFTENSWVSPNATTRSRSNGKSSFEQMGQTANTPSSSVVVEPSSDHPIFLLATPNTGDVNLAPSESTSARANSFDLGALRDQLENEPSSEDSMEEEKTVLMSEEAPVLVSSEGSNDDIEFLSSDNISISSISVVLAPFYRGTRKILILHRDLPLQLFCGRLKVRFGISTKFVDHAGRPRLNIVLDVPPNLYGILEAIDVRAQKLSTDSGSSSEWWPVMSRKRGLYNYPTIRLHIPTVADGDTTRWVTEIYQKDALASRKLVFSRFDVIELDSLFTPGDIIDAYFSLDTYDYHQNAGIRLVAKKLILHSS